MKTVGIKQHKARLPGCEIRVLTREVCERAETVAPRHIVRSLDALHPATFALARREIEGLAFLTAANRLREATAAN